MPEIITKYPDVVMKVLKSGGAQCSVGAKQEILKKCPKENFCSLPGGELCVYGLHQVNQMTQVKDEDIRKLCQSNEGQKGVSSVLSAVVGIFFGVFYLLKNR